MFYSFVPRLESNWSSLNCKCLFESRDIERDRDSSYYLYCLTPSTTTTTTTTRANELKHGRMRLKEIVAEASLSLYLSTMMLITMRRMRQ